MMSTAQIAGVPGIQTPGLDAEATPMNLAEMGIDPDNIDVSGFDEPKEVAVEKAPQATSAHNNLVTAALNRQDSIAVHAKSVGNTSAVGENNKYSSLWQRMKQGVSNLFNGPSAPTVKPADLVDVKDASDVNVVVDIAPSQLTPELQATLERAITDLSITETIRDLLETKGLDVKDKFEIELKKWETGRQQIEQLKEVLQKIYDKRDDKGLQLETLSKDGKQDETHLRALLHKLKEQKWAPDFEIKDSYTKTEADKLFEKLKSKLEDSSFNSQVVMDKMKEISQTSGELHQFMLMIAKAQGDLYKRFIMGMSGR